MLVRREKRYQEILISRQNYLTLPLPASGHHPAADPGQARRNFPTLASEMADATSTPGAATTCLAACDTLPE